MPFKTSVTPGFFYASQQGSGTVSGKIVQDHADQGDEEDQRNANIIP